MSVFLSLRTNTATPGSVVAPVLASICWIRCFRESSADTVKTERVIMARYATNTDISRKWDMVGSIWKGWGDDSGIIVTAHRPMRFRDAFLDFPFLAPT